MTLPKTLYFIPLLIVSCNNQNVYHLNKDSKTYHKKYCSELQIWNYSVSLYDTNYHNYKPCNVCIKEITFEITKSKKTDTISKDTTIKEEPIPKEIKKHKKIRREVNKVHWEVPKDTIKEIKVEYNPYGHTVQCQATNQEGISV